MTRFTSPPLFSLAACGAILAVTLTAPALAQTQTQTECSITVGNVWSGEGTYSFQNNKLAPEEGHFVSFPLTYKCTSVSTGVRPVINITRPSGHRVDTVNFRGGYSESDGFGDGDEMTGKCLENSGCEIEFYASSKDNNCRNVGGTVQRMTISTRIINIGAGDLNLTDQLDLMIEATDDDTVSQKYLDMGYTQWKPTC